MPSQGSACRPPSVIVLVLRSGGDDSHLQFLCETQGQNSAFVASLTIFQQPKVRLFNDTVSRSYYVLYGPLTITVGRKGALKDADMNGFETLYWNGVAE